MSGHGPAASSHAGLDTGVPTSSPWLWDAVRRSITEAGPCGGGGTIVRGATAAVHTTASMLLRPCPQAAPPCAVNLPGHAGAPGLRVLPARTATLCATARPCGLQGWTSPRGMRLNCAAAEATVRVPARPL
eukprot:6388325-Alexandrium_andersonii.AAC.1